MFRHTQNGHLQAGFEKEERATAAVFDKGKWFSILKDTMCYGTCMVTCHSGILITWYKSRPK